MAPFANITQQLQRVESRAPGSQTLRAPAGCEHGPNPPSSVLIPLLLLEGAVLQGTATNGNGAQAVLRLYATPPCSLATPTLLFSHAPFAGSHAHFHIAPPTYLRPRPSSRPRRAQARVGAGKPLLPPGGGNPRSEGAPCSALPLASMGVLPLS